MDTCLLDGLSRWVGKCLYLSWGHVDSIISQVKEQLLHIVPFHQNICIRSMQMPPVDLWICIWLVEG